MEMQELYHLIELQPEIIGKLERIRETMRTEQLDPYLVQLMDIKTAAQAYEHLEACLHKGCLHEDNLQEDNLHEGSLQEDSLQEDSGNWKMLYCQLECARHIHTKYQEKRISETVFIDTMKCFSRFIAECEKRNGRMSFDRGWWTYRQISMNLFRIGALEYQFLECEEGPVIGIHIPSDADLSEKSVDQSLEQADTFFQTFYSGFEYTGYTCDSWLLSPVLKTLLPPESNILAFQKRFHILEVNEEDKSFISWLFPVPADTEYERLPEATNLQRKARNLLLEGRSIGSAYGIMRTAH